MRQTFSAIVSVSGLTLTPFPAIVSISSSSAPRVDHHAVADHRELAAAHHAGRQQAQLVLDAVHHQRVASVVSTLKAHHDIGPAGEPVDDLALALVAPLGAHDRDVAHG